MNRRACLMAATLLALAAPAHAQMGPRADADGDGVITADEQMAAAGRRFERMDANQDGLIDADEIARVKAFMAERMPAMSQGHDPFAAMDADQDGKITRAEFDAFAKARFDAADTNHDGKLDQAEQDAMHPDR